jgi:hypothetical protein
VWRYGRCHSVNLLTRKESRRDGASARRAERKEKDAMANIVKHGKKAKKLTKQVRKAAEKEADIGKTGHKVLQFLGGLGIGTLTKNLGRLPLVKAAPDEAAIVLGGVGALFLKGSKKKFAEDLAWAGANALGGRFVWTGHLIVVSDGKGGVKIEQGSPSQEREVVDAEVVEEKKKDRKAA